jgi:ABC-2 type transport system ATP-binding protein
VPDGARFLPQLFSGLTVPITSVTVQRPTLDDVFFQRTGTTISDASRAASPTTGTTTDGG